MHRLYVLYDARCGLCRLGAGTWASRQPQYVELVFVAAGGSDEANLRFPTLATAGPPEELIVVSDTGDIYRGSSAWIMCLYALEDYREVVAPALRPALRPLARQAFAFVSEHRGQISHWLHLSDRDAADVLRRVGLPQCTFTVEPKTRRCSVIERLGNNL